MYSLCLFWFSSPSVRLEIEPIIPNFDISDYPEQSFLTIACPVATCSEGVTVQFLKEGDMLGEGVVNDTQSTVYNLNLQLDQNTAGTYACKVRTTNPEETVTQEFNITGINYLAPGVSCHYQTHFPRRLLLPLPPFFLALCPRHSYVFYLHLFIHLSLPPSLYFSLSLVLQVPLCQQHHHQRWGYRHRLASP